jgi:hypothetical protein
MNPENRFWGSDEEVARAAQLELYYTVLYSLVGFL